MRDIEALLQPFVGYPELGMIDDAEKELDSFQPELENHPLFWLGRMELILARKQWAAGIALGKTLCARWPDELEFWFKTGYCQHELRQTAEARETLLTAPTAIRKSAVYYYNLACYETQLGNLTDGKRLLELSCKIDKRFRQDCLKDPDLQPLFSR
jgi:tetratricopeptide (TPR) repeat protein